jgi:hypothetical protein
LANSNSKQKYKVDRPKQVRDFKDGINDKFNNTIWEDSGYGMPRGSATNAPDKHPRWLDQSERKQAMRMGKSKPSRRLPDGTQSYKTPDGSPSKHIRPS